MCGRIPPAWSAAASLPQAGPAAAFLVAARYHTPGSFLLGFWDFPCPSRSEPRSLLLSPRYTQTRLARRGAVLDPARLGCHRLPFRYSLQRLLGTPWIYPFLFLRGLPSHPCCHPLHSQSACPRFAS